MHSEVLDQTRTLIYDVVVYADDSCDGDFRILTTHDTREAALLERQREKQYWPNPDRVGILPRFAD